MTLIIYVMKASLNKQINCNNNKMTISTSVFFSILTRAEPELKCVKKNADVDVAFIANDRDVIIVA